MCGQRCGRRGDQHHMMSIIGDARFRRYRYAAHVHRLSAITLLLAGCWETCPPPAEPVTNFVVSIEIPKSDGQYVHASMTNAAGEHLDTRASRRDDITGAWRSVLGHCDGVQQQTGQFKIVAWLNTSAVYDEREPAPNDASALDLVDVKCDDDGCFPTRDARITLR